MHNPFQHFKISFINWLGAVMSSSISLNNAEQLVGAFRVLQLNVSPFSLNKAADTLSVSAARDPGELPDSAWFVCLDDFIIVVGVAFPKYTA